MVIYRLFVDKGIRIIKGDITSSMTKLTSVI